MIASPSACMKDLIADNRLISLPSFNNRKEGQETIRSSPEQGSEILTSPFNPWGLTICPRTIKSSGEDLEFWPDLLFNDFEGVFQPMLGARGGNKGPERLDGPP